MLFRIVRWLYPLVLLAGGWYFLSGSVLHLLYGSMVGVGCFILGMRFMDRIRGELQAKLQAKAEELFKNTDIQKLLADAKAHETGPARPAGRPS